MTAADRVAVVFVTDAANSDADVDGAVANDLSNADDRLSVRPAGIGEVALDDPPADCVVVDGRLPEPRVLETIRRIEDAAPGLPVVVHGGSAALADAALDAGATDVVRTVAGSVRPRIAANRIANAAARYREAGTEQYADALSALLEHSSDRIGVLDEAGRYTYVSPAVEHLMGHDPGDLVGESGFEYVHPEDRPQVREAFESVLANPEETLTVEYRVRDADGEWRWVESRGTNRLDDPAIEGVVINSREITDRRERQRRLSEERAFTESVFAALPDVFYAFDRDGNFLRWNDRLPEVTGYDDEEIRSMHPVELVVPEDRPAVVDAITQVFEKGTTVTVEARFRTTTGEPRPYEFTGARMTRSDGELLGLVGIGRDISERKRRRRRFEAVFDTTPQFVGLTDVDGTMLEANETVLEFAGVDRDAFVGRKLWETAWFRGRPEAVEAAREGIERAAAGESYATEIEVEGAEGTETIEFSVQPITDDRGEIALLVPEGQRITDLKRRERHLKVLHRFLRHNLRNKMTVIRGTADVLGDRLSDPTDREYVAQIEAAAGELIDLSETAHQLSRVAIGGGDDGHQPIDLRETLATVRTDIEREYDGATVRLGPDLDHVVAADWRLRPVFEQLVENAVEHTDDGAPTVEISCRACEGSVSVRIVDDGPGIPEDELVGITTDEDPTQLTHGTGFGLWLVRSVVDDYAGTIEYDRRPEGGSIVTVELPTAAERPEPADEPTDRSG